MKKQQATPLSVLAVVIVLIAGWLFSGQKAPTQSPSTGAPAQTSEKRRSAPEAQPTLDGPKAARTETQTLRPSETITIGTWNIEWLGNPSERSGAGKGVAQEPRDIADVIQRSGASVMALEEISPTGGANPPSSKEMDRVVEALNASGRWEYLLFPSRSGDQFTGVLWDASRVGIVGSKGENAWRVPVPTRKSTQGSGLWVRPPEAVKFTAGPGRTDFVLVIVHMKADYEGDFSRQREEEARALAALLPDVRKVFADDDVVILGDTNMTSPGEPAGRVLTQAGFRDLNTQEAPTHWRGGATDKIFVRDSQPEFQSSAINIRTHDTIAKRSMSSAEYKRRYSDHYPVLTTIRIMEDDD